MSYSYLQQNFSSNSFRCTSPSISWWKVKCTYQNHCEVYKWLFQWTLLKEEQLILCPRRQASCTPNTYSSLQQYRMTCKRMKANLKYMIMLISNELAMRWTRNSFWKIYKDWPDLQQHAHNCKTVPNDAPLISLWYQTRSVKRWEETASY